MIKKRQLYIAIDSKSNRVKIEDVDRVDCDVDGDNGEVNRSEKYFCPYCKQEVIPKMGNKKVWHFCHKGEVCEYLNIKKRDKLIDAELDFSDTRGALLSELDIGSDCEDFMCVECKGRFSKKGGIRWKDNEYICRECFMKQ